MIERLIDTEEDAGFAVLRVALGVVMLAHGLQKIGWVGGGSLAGTLGFFTDFLGIPPAIAWFVILFEPLAGVALIAGAFGRLAAIGTGVIMVVAVWMVHWPVGFFMNWFGSLEGEGYEFHLLALAMSIAVAIRGSGAWSLDRHLIMPALRSARSAAQER